jgi:hypothetical protein
LEVTENFGVKWGFEQSQVDANVGLFSALDATTVYVLGTDRKLYIGSFPRFILQRV